MRIIGCDLHARQQTVAMLDTTTGEVVNMTLTHEGDNVREFYSKLPRPVRVGIEATGSMQWFVNLMEELGIECQVVLPAEIRAAEPRKQKHDRRDADLILKLLMEDRFPAIWRPSKELQDLRSLLRHRHQWVRMRTRIQNALQAIALTNGLRRGPSLWAAAVLNQWQVSASYIAELGQPVTALSFEDANGNGDAAGDRAIFNPTFTSRNTATGVNAVCRSGSGATSIVAPDVCNTSNTVGYVTINPAAQYVQALPGARTTVGRNTLDSPGLNNWNMAFFKKTRLSERFLLELRAEMQNAFNHGQPILGSGNISGFNTNAINGTDLVFVGDNPNFLRPQNVLTNGGSNSPFSGIVTGGNAGFRRFVQFGLKVRF